MAYDNDQKKYGSKYGRVDDNYKAKGIYLKEKDEKYSSRPLDPKDPEYEMKGKEAGADLVARQAIPRMEDMKIEPLRRMEPIIVGDLFDRVRFLEERIAELREIVGIREGMHVEMEKDIDADIREKQSMVTVISDSHERRNLKLDISVLRKERRNESIQFWKDLLELKTELRTLMEQYETESKIVGIFKGMSNNGINGQV